MWLSLLYAAALAIAATVLLSVLAFAVARYRLAALTPRSGSKDVVLRVSPNHLSVLDLAALAILLASKYVYHPCKISPSIRRAVPSTESLPLPAISVRGLLQIRDEDETTFRKALVQPSTSAGPISPFFLVALTGPLVIYILAQRSCPIQPLGAVNTRNQIHVYDPSVACDSAALGRASKEGKLRYHARLGSGRRVKRGLEFSIEISIYYEDNGESNVLLVQHLSYLQFLPRDKTWVESKQETAKVEVDSEPWLKSAASRKGFLLPMNRSDPRAWAACCKDYNPIHISSLAARLFGFKSVIAHGNYAVARAWELIASKTLGSLTWPTRAPFSIQMKFVKPMVLPMVAQVRWRELDVDLERTQTTRFEMIQEEKTFITGVLLEGSLNESSPMRT